MYGYRTHILSLALDAASLFCSIRNHSRKPLSLAHMKSKLLFPSFLVWFYSRSTAQLWYVFAALLHHRAHKPSPRASITPKHHRSERATGEGCSLCAFFLFNHTSCLHNDAAVGMSGVSIKKTHFYFRLCIPASCDECFSSLLHAVHASNLH